MLHARWQEHVLVVSVLAVPLGPELRASAGTAFVDCRHSALLVAGVEMAQQNSGSTESEPNAYHEAGGHHHPSPCPSPVAASRH